MYLSLYILPAKKCYDQIIRVFLLLLGWRFEIFFFTLLKSIFFPFILFFVLIFCSCRINNNLNIKIRGRLF